MPDYDAPVGEFREEGASEGSPCRTPPTVAPGLLYHDAPGAVEWLCRVLGFQKRLVIPGANGTISHAHLTIGNGGVMLSSAEGFDFPQLCKSPREVGGVGTAEIIVYIADPGVHCERAVAEGAEVVIPLEDKPYGGARLLVQRSRGVRVGVWIVRPVGGLRSGPVSKAVVILPGYTPSILP